MVHPLFFSCCFNDNTKVDDLSPKCIRFIHEKFKNNNKIGYK